MEKYRAFICVLVIVLSCVLYVGGNRGGGGHGWGHDGGGGGNHDGGGGHWGNRGGHDGGRHNGGHGRGHNNFMGGHGRDHNNFMGGHGRDHNNFMGGHGRDHNNFMGGHGRGHHHGSMEGHYPDYPQQQYNPPRVNYNNVNPPRVKYNINPPWANYNVDPPWGNQYVDPGYAYLDRNNFGGAESGGASGCPRPKVNDAAKVEIEGCKTNVRQDATHFCVNENLPIPYGTSAVISCVKGRRLLRLTSRCQEDGCWSPALRSNCNDLFDLLAEVKGQAPGSEPEPGYQKPKALHCPQVMVPEGSNFAVTCHLPGGQGSPNKDPNCLSQFGDSVPSGTRIAVTCRPPATPVQSGANELTCKDGRWEGKIQKVICSVPAKGTLTVKPQNPKVTPTIPLPTIPATQNPKNPPAQNTKIPPAQNPKIPPAQKPTVPAAQPDKSTPLTCAPLKARSGVDLSCAWTGTGTQVGTNDCNAKMPVGTEARYACAQYYESTSALPTLYRKCKEDGTWSGSSDFRCVVECGRDNVLKVAYITHSLPTLQGQWPWHAALFRNRSSDRESWEYICGGTLITKKALLTAAHCVTLLQTSKVVEASDLQVHLGKYHREVNDEHVQIKQIDNIIVNPNYNPYNYDSDVAIIVFKTEVTIGHFVRPICFLTTSDSALEDLQLSENSTGTVVGWGYDENNKLADDLRMAHLRVVGTRECAKSMMGSSISSLNVRSTTFCAGYANGTNVCNGDSGSGMYFPTVDTDNTRWYIQGLVSVGIALSNGHCNPETFSVFTRLGRYADFITKTLSEYDAL